jgi:hypothetical protein
MTDKIITPEEFLAEEQRMMFELWDKFHSVLTQFSVLRSTGKIDHYVAGNIPNDSAKEKYYEFQRKLCRQPNVICVVRIAEAWASMGTGVPPTVRPSQDPNRKTAVMVDFFTPKEEKNFFYLDKDGKLVEYDKENEGKMRMKFGNPFKSFINLKNKNYN